MEGIGERLRSVREARKLSLKDVSKETNIVVKYIEALENEEFDKFPGDTYLIGFLRTYAEYLKLDADEIIHSYKGYKIGESVTPLEELTKPTGSTLMISLTNLFNQYRNYFYIGGVAVGIILVIWIFSSIFSSRVDEGGDDSIKNIKKEYDVSKQKSEIESIRNLQLTNESGYILVYKKEAVQFLVENKEVMFLLKDVRDNKARIEVFPGNYVTTLDMDKSSTFKIREIPREVVLTLKGLTENRAKIQVMLGQKIEVEEKEIAAKDNVKKEGDSTKVIAQNEKNLKIIFEAEFIQKTYLELYLDGMEKRKGIVEAGTKDRWEATEFIQLKIGNAGGIKAKINGKDYAFGLPGQVANKVITWKKDVNNPNLYHIVVKDW